jgi:hypothetical protein
MGKWPTAGTTGEAGVGHLPRQALAVAQERDVVVCAPEQEVGWAIVR